MTRMASLFGQTRVTVFVTTLSLVVMTSPGAGQEAQLTIIKPTLDTGDLGTKVTQAGAFYNITGGTRSGNGEPNLFHSFGDFSIGTTDTALFRAIDVVGTAYSGSSIQNIIGRVTGTKPSGLFGTLDTQSNFPTANLFFLNPNGIVFGPNATIDVGGSANFVAGDYLRMTETDLFFANPAQTSTLSVAAVTSFGFLAGNPLGTISIEGGTVKNTSALTLVGRDIVDSSGNTTTPGILVRGGTLSNSDGRINLVSVGLPQDLVKGGEIQATSLTSAPAASGHAFNTMGEIKLSGASLDTSGTIGGSVVIRGGQMTIDNGRIIASKTGNTSDSSAGIDIKLDGAFALNFSEPIALNTNTSGAGDGGAIKIAASKVTVNFTGEVGTATAIISGTSGTGKGGDVVITATGDVNLNRVSIISDTVEFSPFGPASGTGNAGSIVIKGENVTVTNSEISSSGVSGKGNTGALEIEATSSVKLIGSSFVSSVSRSGQLPGNVTITAKDLSMEGGAVITAHTQGAGNAGNIIIKADNLVIGVESPVLGSSISTDSIEGATGNAGSIDLSIGRLTLNPGSTISSVSAGGGNAGTVEVHGLGGKGTAANVITLDNSTISTEISGGSEASTPSDITITAHTLALANFAHIRADTTGAAPAGNIALNVDTLTAGSSQINSSSFPRFFPEDSAAGNAGTITIQGSTSPGSPATSVSLDSSTISTQIAGGNAASPAASIDITAHTLALANGGQIGADTFGAAAAGNITFHVDTLTAGSSQITSTSFPSFFPEDATAGNAGSITIQGIDGSGSLAANVSLDASEISTTIDGGTSSTIPATIDITAQTVNLANGSQIKADTSGSAPAGNIALNVDTLTVLNGETTVGRGFSGIFSTSGGILGLLDATAGNAGSITIQGPDGPGSAATRVSLDGGTFFGSETCCTFISTQINEGSAANTPAAITVTAHTLTLANARVVAGTAGPAPAGNIALNVDTLTVLNGETTVGGGFSGIFSSSSLVDATAGNAGSITIQGPDGPGSAATRVSLDGGTINTEVDRGSAFSTPGAITITAHTLALANVAEILADTTGDAPASNIALVTQQLTMTPDSAITSNSRGGTGEAGSITITGAGSAPTTIAGGTVQAQSETSASAGNIKLQAPGDLTLLGTKVSVKNTGPGNAGSIGLLAGNDLLVRNSPVSTESAEASGGNIKLTAPNIIRLVDSTLTSSVQGQAGSNGGNINIDPQLVVIQNSRILADANAGAGGSITIAASGAVLVDPNSLLRASAGPAGVSGSVNINAPIQILSGALVPLKLAYSQAGLSGDRCAADPQGQFSSFVQTGRDGVPQVPGALSPSPLSFLDTLTSGSWGSQVPNLAAARFGLDAVSFDDSTRFRFHSACRS